MNKKIVLSLALSLAGASAIAGGLNTNTNPNAAYLRYFAQDANVSLTSLYANPAGSAFLSKGWHFGICDQIAIQRRNVTTTFPLFKLNTTPGWTDENGSHRYVGKAFAPLIPSADLSYNSGKKWSINAHLGLVGGGGACEYLDGIGSFEAMYSGAMATEAISQIATAIQGNPTQMAAIQNAVKQQVIASGVTDPAAIAAAVQAAMPNAVASAATTAYTSNPTAYTQGYSLNAYMKGNSYMYGLSVGATYKITDNLAVYAGVRGIYATANYNGYVQDFKVTTAAGTKSYGDNTLSMNCDQTGYGITPILGIHWTINKHWNVAAKYEFKTRIRMSNTTRMNEYTTELAKTNATLGQFADGKSVANDIPGLLGVGVQYSPIENVRIGLGYHWLQETRATQYNDKQNLIDKDTHEILASAEWKCCKYLTLSLGYQRTMYGVSDDYMNDVSFNLTNNSIGCGVRIHPSKLFNIDLGYMHTIYGSRTVTTATAVGDKIDMYERKNDVIGVGLNFAW